MGCDLPDDVLDYIVDCEVAKSEPPLLEIKTVEKETKNPPKETKKKKGRSKDGKEGKREKEKGLEKKEEKGEVGEVQEPPSTKPKTSVTMETLPEELIASMNQDQNISRRFSKLLVADGSIRRAVEKNKAAFWEQSAKRRLSVKESIDAALSEIQRIDQSADSDDGGKVRFYRGYGSMAH